MYENISVALTISHIKLASIYGNVFETLINRNYDVWTDEADDENPNSSWTALFEAYRSNEFGELTIKFYSNRVMVYGEVTNRFGKKFDSMHICHTPDEVLRYAVDTSMPSDPRDTLMRIKCIMESKEFMDKHPDMSKLDVFRRVREESFLFGISMDDILATYEKTFCE